MSNAITAAETGYKAAWAELSCAVDFGSSVEAGLSGQLDAGELVTGTPTVSIVSKTSGADDVTFSQIAVTTATRRIRGRQCLAGEAVQFRVVGGTSGATYVLAVRCSTDATPARPLEGRITIVVI